MEDYQYPDYSDRITAACIGLNEYYPNYWGDSEKRVLNGVKELILKFYPENSGKLLDAGCGEGRLIPFFLPVVSQMVAIEPDRARYMKAMALVDQETEGKKVRIYQTSLDRYRTEETFDIVLSSHVVQHIPTYSLDGHLKALAGLTKKGGIVIMNTCHSTEEKEIKLLNKLTETGEFAEYEIDEEEFNRLACSSGILPLRMFTREFLEDKMAALGFRQVFCRVFHVNREDQMAYGEQVDEEVNRSEELKKRHGRDISLVFRKE